MSLNIKKREITDGKSSRIPIPAGAWMRLRLRGAYKFSLNTTPIVWAYKQPPRGATVYCVNWRSLQQNLQASHTYIQP